ncbi:hypothetical protein EO244_02030 [Ancylomarina salipaludis]|uniref:Uncharacterized protein n=1 Tax=Ancylomarina salipaludis TaxID=2501299 RepID=A0A4Q1JQN6_9BACT|nr:hypothetical protein [Ancylomarina salipaludis]RXQ97686.1 hypothetical protein EO244_02030 [Ancylomarina salipaludis]
MQTSWLNSINQNIDNQIETYISVKDYRFYQIEKLKRIAALLDREEKSHCLNCKHGKIELEKIVNELDRLINKSGVNRSEYEKRVEKLIKHLKNDHNIYQAHHFTYTYSGIYTLVGIAFGLTLSYGIFYSFNPHLFFMCAGIGMVIGNILGARKDSFQKRSGKQI